MFTRIPSFEVPAPEGLSAYFRGGADDLILSVEAKALPSDYELDENGDPESFVQVRIPGEDGSFMCRMLELFDGVLAPDFREDDAPWLFDPDLYDDGIAIIACRVPRSSTTDSEHVEVIVQHPAQLQSNEEEDPDDFPPEQHGNASQEGDAPLLTSAPGAYVQEFGRASSKPAVGRYKRVGPSTTVRQKKVKKTRRGKRAGKRVREGRDKVISK